MAQQPLLIPLIYARVISNAAARSPAEARRVLAGTGLDEPGGSQGGMTAAQYRRLLQNAAAVSGDPGIALKAGLNLPITTHGDLGIATTTAPDLRTALEVFSTFTRLRNPFGGTRLVEGEREVELVVEMSEVMADQREPALDLVCAAFASGTMQQALHIMGNVSLKMSRPPPANAEEYAQLLGLPMAWGENRTAFVFPLRSMDRALPNANPEAFEQAVARMRSLYSQVARPASWQEAVQAVFARNSGHLCTVAEVSAALNVSPRTLDRRLRAERCAFQPLLDGWLSGQALLYLERGGLSVEATAALLGYTDEANFRRAFRRWFGQPPRRYLADAVRKPPRNVPA